MKKCPKCNENSVIRFNDKWGKGECCFNHQCTYIQEQPKENTK
jgi:hypothetical protein